MHFARWRRAAFSHPGIDSRVHLSSSRRPTLEIIEIISTIYFGTATLSIPLFARIAFAQRRESSLMEFTDASARELYVADFVTIYECLSLQFHRRFDTGVSLSRKGAQAQRAAAIKRV